VIYADGRSSREGQEVLNGGVVTVTSLVTIIIGRVESR
jgi:hypothetical protein